MKGKSELAQVRIEREDESWSEPHTGHAKEKGNKVSSADSHLGLCLLDRIGITAYMDTSKFFILTVSETVQIFSLIILGGEDWVKYDPQVTTRHRSHAEMELGHYTQLSYHHDIRCALPPAQWWLFARIIICSRNVNGNIGSRLMNNSQIKTCQSI